MNLALHCQNLTARIQNDLIEAPDTLSEEELAEAIRKKINRHAIGTNVLRTYAAIYFYHHARGVGITREALDLIVTFEDQVTKHDVTYSTNRLLYASIVVARGATIKLSQV